MQKALDVFHTKNPDWGIALNVTRHPYSFHGGTVSPDGHKTWLWRDGLYIYCGDAFQNQVVALGIPAGRVNQLRSTDGAEAATALRSDPRLYQMLTMLAQHRGSPAPPPLEELAALLESSPVIERAAKGKSIGPFDRWIGEKGIEGLKQLGAECGTAFDMDVEFQWHPVDSQRLLLWAGTQGRAELFMDALNHDHFTRRNSASNKAALLAAVAEAGLSVEDAETFLASDEFSEDVWRSYRETIEVHGIHSIPLFVFNGPRNDAGPFRSGHGEARVINGSASASEFLGVFNGILETEKRHIAAAL